MQGVAGSLFFWTFELLVFMVLLNFLLAIIVDAFSVVKVCSKLFIAPVKPLWSGAKYRMHPKK